MSIPKPTARVVLIALISLALIAATYMTVQGAFAKAETRGAQAHTVNGLQTNFNHDRSTAAELDALQAQIDAYSQPDGSYKNGGGCHSELRDSPLD